MARPKGDDNELSCVGLKIHIYVCEGWTGELIEQAFQLHCLHRAHHRSEEMKPSWFSFSSVMDAADSQVEAGIPFNEMVLRSCCKSPVEC